ncbi:MAG: biopolymer transporter ExbD [bacterium]
MNSFELPRKRTARVQPDINITPLVDVVLVLLIIFMVVAPQMDQDIPVELPGIFNPDPDVEGARAPLMLSLTRAGTFYVESSAYDFDGAVNKLREIQAAEPNRRLALRADSALPYSQVRDVFFDLQEAGFPGVSLMINHKHQYGDDGSAAPPAAAGQD